MEDMEWACDIPTRRCSDYVLSMLQWKVGIATARGAVYLHLLPLWASHTDDNAPAWRGCTYAEGGRRAYGRGLEVVHDNFTAVKLDGNWDFVFVECQEHLVDTLHLGNEGYSMYGIL